MKRLTYILLAFLYCFTCNAQQNTRTAYFMDSYAHRYRFNPAFEPKCGHVSFLLGNLSIAPESNLGLSTFVYPAEDGQNYTFLSKEVDAETFMNKLSKNNLVHAGADMNLFSLAFKTDNFTHFIDVGIRSNSYVNAPYDLFRFIKEGNVNGTSFNMDRLSVRTANYAELCYGLSTYIGDRFRIGGRLKLLGGIAQSKVEFTRARITASGEQWCVDANGSLTACLPTGFVIGLNDNGSLDFNNIQTPDSYKNIFPAGWGAAMDLGLVWDITDCFQASFAVLDLGMIKWKNGVKASTKSDTWEYSGLNALDFNSENGFQQDWAEQLDEIKNELLESVAFYQDSEEKVNTFLEMTLNGGLEYILPSYDKFSAGLLCSARINGKCSWVEGRLSANWSPTNWFSLCASGAYSKFGPSAGVAMNLRAGPIDFFAGVDSLIPFSNINSQYIPIGRMNTNASIGLNILFGFRE